MKKNIRLEHLFPNIHNERKYKWLENALLSRVISDGEISDFTLEEYIDMMDCSKTTYTNMQGEDVTEEVIKKHYQDWIHSPADFVYSLSSHPIEWNNDITEKLAVCLSKNPLALPNFLNTQASDIIGLFLGQRALLSSVRLTKSFHYDTFWKNQERSKDKYQWSNFDAKYKLSLFLSVLDNLLDLGVNLQEYQFRNLDCADSYHKLNSAGSWNELLRKMTINLESDYVRYDGLKISKESLLEYMDFSDLQEFLDKVVSLTEIEYYIDFIDEAVTLDPNHILPETNSIRKMTDFPKENLVEIKTLCEKMKQKLKRVAFETETIICRRRIEDLEKMTSEHTFETKVDYDAFLEEIEKLYRILVTLPLKDREELKQKLDQLTDDEMKEQLSSKEKERQEKENWNARVVSLEERMARTEEKVDSMEKVLLEYLKYGGKNPLHTKTSLSREEQIGIVKSFSAKTTGEKFRKALLLSTLKAGVVGILVGTIFFHGNIERNFSKVSRSTYENEEIEDSEITLPEEDELPGRITKPSKRELPEKVIIGNPIDNASSEQTPLKTNEEIILEILQGKWGNDPEREESLRSLGYDYDLIREWVNKIIDLDGNISEQEYEKVLDNIKRK